MSHSLRTCGTLAFIIALASSGALGQDSANSSKAKTSAGIAATDSAFMKKAADGGMAEVELGQLAVQKATSSEVKAFGQRMVDDHGKANDQLKQLAAEKHVDLPLQPSAKHEAMKTKLEALSGSAFDQAYVAEMVKDHKQDVAEFQRQSKTAKDDDVKSFAKQTLPTLKEHLKQIESIRPGHKTESSALQKQ